MWSASIPTGASIEVRSEGVLHLDAIPETLLAALFDGAACSRVTLGYDDLRQFCEAEFLVSSFIATTQIDDVISYSCILMSNGVVEFQ